MSQGLRAVTGTVSGFPAAEGLVSTKLTPPDLPQVHVDRSERRKRLADAPQVTAVIAPAGFGKTVLVREWIGDDPPTAIAWYSLDALDANPSVFWRHVLAALDAVLGIGDEPTALLAERGAADPTFVHALLATLLDIGAPVTLVLDDLHLLTDRTALEQLAVLLERAGPALRLVFTARTPPSLPLARWRLERRLLELREDDLRFAEPAAAELLTGLRGRPLGEAELADLVGRTEGWVAGLQLAALADPEDPRRPIRDQPLDGTLVASYLLEEIVDRLPASQREVALDLAVLDEFDELLATALIDRPDGIRRLHDLLHGQLLISRIGGERSTYRFHQLLRDLLREQLRVRDPDRWSVLQHRAAELLRGRGNVDGAFAHLLASGDVDAAIELVVRHGLALSDQGWSAHFRHWMQRLPADLSVDDPALMLDLAFAQFTAGDLDEAERWTDRAARRLGVDDPRVCLRSLTVAIARGDEDEMERSLSVLDRVGPAGGSDAFEQRIHTTTARAYLLLGRRAEADAALDRAVAGHADELARSVAVPAIRARLRVADGEVATAERLVDEALGGAAALGASNNPAMLEAMIAATAVALAGGRVADAVRYHEELLEVVDTVDYPYSRAHAAALTIELSARQRGWAATAGMLDDLCRQVGWSSHARFGGVVALPQARALLAAGRIEEARPLVAALRPGPTAVLVQAALLRAERRLDAVLELLARRDEWSPADEVEALVLSASASTGRSAEEHLRRALEVAEPLGLVDPFVDRGDDLERLLRRLPDELRPRATAAASVPAGPKRASVGVLTARERDVLALLPTHLSNAAIGRQLYVSVNTVKTNLRMLYRKLGTSSRAETVTVARDLGLLPGAPRDA